LRPAPSRIAAVDALLPIAEGLWTVRAPQQFMGLHVGTRR
jgi:hypothetical protein